jgi:hypothetical protein
VARQGVKASIFEVLIRSRLSLSRATDRWSADCLDRDKMAIQGWMLASRQICPTSDWLPRSHDRAGATPKMIRFRRVSNRAPRVRQVNSYRTSHGILLAGAMLAMALADAQLGRALCQGRLDARYNVTLGGLPVGRGSWVVDIGDDHFSTSANGATAGVMRVFFYSGQGQSAARGTVSGGNLFPSSYASSIYTDKKYDEVRMVFSGGNVKEFSAEPPNTPNAARIPLTEAHRRGVSDPMTAGLIRVPGTGDAVAPQACERTLSIFDGRMRYNLQLGFKRFETVSSHAGYQGAVVVCSVHFIPLAGHVPDRYAIRYVADLRDMEMSLAPIAGTRILVPYQISIPTPIGTGMLYATQFISTPQPGKASAKTQ